MSLSKKDSQKAVEKLTSIYKALCWDCMYNKNSGSDPDTWCSADPDMRCICIKEYRELRKIIDTNYKEA